MLLQSFFRPQNLMPEFRIFHCCLRKIPLIFWSLLVKSHMHWRLGRSLVLIELRFPRWAPLIAYIFCLIEEDILLYAASIAGEVKTWVTMSNFTVLLLISIVNHLTHLSGPFLLYLGSWLYDLGSASDKLYLHLISALRHGVLSLTLHICSGCSCIGLISLISGAALVWVTY